MRTWSWLRKVALADDTPEALARGLAVGFFFGVSIFWSVQFALALAVSHLVRGNKVVALAMTAVSNPLTALPLYGFSYLVGHVLTGYGADYAEVASVRSFAGFLSLGRDSIVAILVGTTVVGMVGALALYFSSERLLAALRRRHAQQELRGP